MLQTIAAFLYFYICNGLDDAINGSYILGDIEYYFYLIQPNYDLQ